MDSDTLTRRAPIRLGDCHAFGLTDTGRVRRENQDRFLIDAALNFVAVADGMGGHAFGARASATALDCVAGKLADHARTSGVIDPEDPDATVQDACACAMRAATDALNHANATLHAMNLRERLAQRSMGTTLTGIWQPRGAASLVAFHIGDSRLYRYRDGKLMQLSRDQTLYQQAIENGAIEHLPPRNVLLQALGPLPSIAPVVQTHAWLPGDRYLLCSDGLHGEVPHGEIEAVLAEVTSRGIEETCRRLVALALDAGGKDNVTAVIACF
ncbi:PP2C family serine/threonine-protein phosphatase [Caballeronia sp. BR00000012568055]|uniref:PP2C family protein-serine/threonine phosphatase n=1 Tax=Caballeronia sp. BR00000012568055 TaxID=2918761 RepID=UPI0023F7AF59|nr:protein phosphatase 2C domain-containing protein [Caballeronia sp. BR00000012568055]